MRDYIKNINGGTLHIKNKEEEFFICKGYRDHENEIPIDKDTRFPTASAGKFFVSIGIMKLIENNQLSLQSSIGDILSFNLHSIDQSVTIEELLTHTSGIPNYFDEESMNDYAELWKDYPNYKIRSSIDLLPLLIDKPMQFPRGERFAYNDSGFVILGMIIEELTKKPFDQYLDEVLFKPLNMINTGYYELDRLPKNCANAYIYDHESNSYYMNIYSVDVKGTGAGGAFTNAYDVQKLWNGLFTEKILKKETLSVMLKKHVDLGGYGYGYGIWIDESDIPYFTGEDPGVTFISWCNPTENQIITLISNYQDDIFSIFHQIKNDL